jgi:formylglycine-generating enzyme required for sulfatase activity
MADIFVSYSRADRDTVANIVAALEAEGWAVWWDTRLRAGEQWDEVIEREINAARCVVVVWSPLSVTRYWVKVEANFGLSRGILVPISIEGAEPPLAFTLIQSANLTGWDGGAQAPALRRTVEDIREKLRRAPGPASAEYARAPSAGTEAPAASPSQAAHNHAAEDWKLIEHSTDPRDFRAFIAEHKSGLLVRKAQHKLEDLADEALAAAGRDKGALERFLKTHSDSVHADAVRAKLAEFAAEEQRKRDEAARFEARWNEKRKRQELEARYRAEGRIRVAPAIARPAGLEWFLPGAGKAESFKDADFAPEMVVVPAGKFTMGTTDSEIARLTKEYGDYFKDEAPQHEVTIPQPFAIGRYAVTFDEWEAAQKDKDWQRITGRAPYSPDDQGWGKGRRPAVDVCWDDAQAYVKWLSEKTGKGYWLPSEAEWEYACRAGTRTAFWWGDTISTAQANYDGNHTYWGGQKGEYRQKTVPVDSFEPNPWGLYQVHGNVWDWVEDCWHKDYHNAPSDGSAWTSGDCTYRVLRGGSWNIDPLLLRAARRGGYSPGTRYGNVGFRVAVGWQDLNR